MVSVTISDVEMTNVDVDSTIIRFDNTVEVAHDADTSNGELPFEPYEGMNFVPF
jgi:hypothetical protein